MYTFTVITVIFPIKGIPGLSHAKISECLMQTKSLFFTVSCGVMSTDNISYL